jgi:hypothetical protein
MNNVVRIDLYIAVRNLRANWNNWEIVTRAAAIAGLRRADVSVATIARIAECSEATIRRLEVIDRLSPELKARIRAGEPSGKFVALARFRRFLEAIGTSASR